MTVLVESQKTRGLYLLLRDQIIRGELPAGSRMPGEHALAETHSVSRVTIRRVLEQLATQGLIIRRAGAGTFVAVRAASQPMTADLTDLLSQLNAMGATTTVHLLRFGYGPAPAQIAEALGLITGHEVQSSTRLRYIGDAPFSYLTVHVPAEFGRRYSEADLAATPLIALLERSGVELARATQTVNAVLAGPEVAQALEVDVGAPLLSIERAIFDSNGVGVEFLQGLYRPDRYAFRMNLMRSGEEGARHWEAQTIVTSGQDDRPDDDKTA